jgi:hypothetical protein
MRGPNGDEMQAELTGGSKLASGPDSDAALAMHGASDTTTASLQDGGIRFPQRSATLAIR